MKTVFTNSELVHAFNLQNQTHGRTSNGSMYFKDNKIYSYGSHYLLGEFIDKETIIINNVGYSVTTSNHISKLMRATSDKRQFFTNEIDSKLVLDRLTNLFKLLSNARLKADYYTTTINNLFERYFSYVDYIKPKKSKEHRQIVKLYNSFTENAENLLEVIKEQTRKDKEKKLKEVKKKLKKWRTFETSWLSNQTGNDFLRINKANNIIETSQGVKITIEEGKRLLKLIDLKKIVGARVDNKYIVNAFNGLLKVGCHNIELKEINNIKKQLCK